MHRATIKDIAELLIINGANVNAKDVGGRTPLLSAIRNGHKEVAELLVIKGADVNAKDDDGLSPLWSALKVGKKEIAKLLITKGANVNEKDELGETPLDWVIRTRQKEIADLLIKHSGKTGEELKLADQLAQLLADQLDPLKDKLDKLSGLILGGEDATDEPSIEKLQGVFVIRGKAGGKYEVQYHTGDNEWQLRETVTLQANRQLYIDSSSYDEKRFYRIKLIE